MIPSADFSPRGICDERFQAVHDAFAGSLADGTEFGGGVCVTHRGEVVVDLVGGTADAQRTRAWDERTIAMVWSTTKGMTATCAHLLAATGELDLDAPIVRYWPEFGAEDKAAITVAMALSHQAGVPGLSGGDVGDDVFDARAMAERVAAEAPLWEPGTRHGYHSFTIGWIAGELVRRITGVSLGRFFAERVAAPLGLDFHIGLAASEDERVAEVRALPLLPTAVSPFGAALERGEPIQTAVANSWGRFTDVGVCRLRAARGAEVPGANGFGTARAVAGLYGALATDGRIGDVTLPARVRARMGSVASASSRDAVLLLPTRYALGFQKGAIVPSPSGLWFPESGFGHPGQGGSFGLADPACELSIGYVTGAHMGEPEGPRAQAIIDAAYAAATAGGELASAGTGRAHRADIGSAVDCSVMPQSPAIADVAGRLHEQLAARRDELLQDLATLVALESPSEDLAALGRTADWLERWLAPVGRVTPFEGADGRRHLLLEPPAVRERSPLLMCHYDTVWPVGTTAEWAFAIDGDVVSGPGVFDMKASIVAARHTLLGLQQLGLPCNARLLVSADEEIGNRTSRELILEQARRTTAALVLEPPLDDGRLKTKRKGRGQARIVAHGRAAHAGVSPEAGVNAIEEMARLVLAVREIADSLPGVSATVGQIAGGTAVNVVPERAAVEIDLRAWTADALRELKLRLEALGPHDPAARVETTVDIERPPMERMDAVDALLARCREGAGALGMTVDEGSTGGCSEGNFMAAAGVPTLDGLGIRGFGPHTRDERIELSHLVPQAALVGALASDLGA